MKKGGRNLFLLGAGSVLIALITTSISLLLYHNSGDIYLDRSRPGFLPDEKEATEEEHVIDDYKFSDSGPIDQKTLEEYSKKLKTAVDEATSITNPYSSSPLSDKSLGITGEDTTEP